MKGLVDDETLKNYLKNAKDIIDNKKGFKTDIENFIENGYFVKEGDGTLKINWLNVKTQIKRYKEIVPDLYNIGIMSALGKSKEKHPKIYGQSLFTMEALTIDNYAIEKAINPLILPNNSMRPIPSVYYFAQNNSIWFKIHGTKEGEIENLGLIPVAFTAISSKVEISFIPQKNTSLLKEDWVNWKMDETMFVKSIILNRGDILVMNPSMIFKLKRGVVKSTTGSIVGCPLQAAHHTIWQKILGEDQLFWNLNDFQEYIYEGKLVVLDSASLNEEYPLPPKNYIYSAFRNLVSSPADKKKEGPEKRMEALFAKHTNLLERLEKCDPRLYSENHLKKCQEWKSNLEDGTKKITNNNVMSYKATLKTLEDKVKKIEGSNLKDKICLIGDNLEKIGLLEKDLKKTEKGVYQRLKKEYETGTNWALTPSKLEKLLTRTKKLLKYNNNNKKGKKRQRKEDDDFSEKEVILNNKEYFNHIQKLSRKSADLEARANATEIDMLINLFGDYKNQLATHFKMCKEKKDEFTKSHPDQGSHNITPLYQMLKELLNKCPSLKKNGKKQKICNGCKSDDPPTGYCFECIWPYVYNFLKDIMKNTLKDAQERYVLNDLIFKYFKYYIGIDITQEEPPSWIEIEEIIINLEKGDKGELRHVINCIYNRKEIESFYNDKEYPFKPPILSKEKKEKEILKVIEKVKRIKGELAKRNKRCDCDERNKFKGYDFCKNCLSENLEACAEDIYYRVKIFLKKESNDEIIQKENKFKKEYQKLLDISLKKYKQWETQYNVVLPLYKELDRLVPKDMDEESFSSEDMPSSSEEEEEEEEVDSLEEEAPFKDTFSKRILDCMVKSKESAGLLIELYSKKELDNLKKELKRIEDLKVNYYIESMIQGEKEWTRHSTKFDDKIEAELAQRRLLLNDSTLQVRIIKVKY